MQQNISVYIITKHDRVTQLLPSADSCWKRLPVQQHGDGDFYRMSCKNKLKRILIKSTKT